MKKKLLALAIFSLSLLPTLLLSQVTDNFSDGDFTSNPVWSGDDASWQVVSGQLNTNGPAVTGTVVYLSTPSTLSSNAQWEFFVNPKASTSSGNYVDVFLTSDSARLSGNNSGYFVRIGDTSDDICLYLKQGSTLTKIIDGTNQFLTSSTNNPTKVKITRTSANDWTLYADNTGSGTSYQLQGIVNDAVLSGSSYFGVLVKYSASNFNKYFIDDIIVGAIVVDVTPPTVLSVSVTGANSIDVLFSETIEQTSAENISNYLVNNSIGNPSQATRDNNNTALVHLVFASNFQSGVNNTLTVSNVEDVNSNVISGSNTANFSYSAPVLPAYRDVVINEIFADPTPKVKLPEAEFIELYNRSNKTLDLSSWKFSSKTATGTLNSKLLMAGQHLILCRIADTALFQTYGPVLGLVTWPSLINSGTTLYLKDNSGNLMDSVKYDLSSYHHSQKQNGGWSIELINPEYTGSCPIGNNWTSSADSSGGTPGVQNSVYDISPDVTGPFIVNVTILDSTHINVCMNESIGTAIDKTTTYLIDNGIGNPSAAVWDSVNTDCVKLTLSNPIIPGTTYGIELKNVSDCSGNQGSTAVFNFILNSSVSANYKDIIINEIFADPSPQVHLPTEEFIELHNRSSNAIDLAGWKIKTKTSGTGLIFSYNLLPGDYLILCANADTALYRSYGPVMGLGSWPTLTNNGTTLYLSDDAGNLVDSVKYDLTFYKDVQKQGGGWTMELINPQTLVACDPASNWSASVDTMGGTPGMQNSVYSTKADTTAPVINSVSVIDSNHVSVCLNEGISGNWSSPNSYFLNEGIGNPSSVKQISTDCVELTLSTNLGVNKSYDLSLSGITDCSGNAVANVTFTFTNYVATPLDVQFNEIMSKESPAVLLPAYEYVELYNKTSLRINMQNWTFKAGNFTDRVLPAITIEPDSFVVITSVDGKAAYSGSLPVYSLSSFPSLTNAGALLILKNEKGMIMDTVRYSDTWYQTPSKKNGGWSLEKVDPLINTNCMNGTTNWSESNDASGGTPGYRNSVFSTDLTGPFMATYYVQDSVHINLCFNEMVDTTLLGNASNYSINKGIGSPASVQVFSAYCVILTLSNPLQADNSYLISISNMTDCAGNVGSSTAKPIDFNSPLANFSSSQNWLNVTFSDLSSVNPGSISSWDWNFGDSSPNSSIKNPTHTYTTSGNFLVCLKVTASNLLTDTVCKTLKIQNVGIEETEASLFQVYPNPGNGNIYVEGNNIKHLTVYDVRGSIVYQTKEVISGRRNIDLQNLISGIYFIKAGNEHKTTHKIIHIIK